MSDSIQIPEQTSMSASEAALMRWYPNATLGSIRALRVEIPGWPVVPAAVYELIRVAA